MAKDDYFKIVYVILTELYGCRKAGERVHLDDIGAERLQVNEGYLLSIFSELLENGYIKGPVIRKTKTGMAVSDMEDIDITMKGIEYLQENSMMKKVMEALKDVKDIIPGV